MTWVYVYRYQNNNLIDIVSRKEYMEKELHLKFDIEKEDFEEKEWTEYYVGITDDLDSRFNNYSRGGHRWNQPNLEIVGTIGPFSRCDAEKLEFFLINLLHRCGLSLKNVMGRHDDTDKALEVVLSQVFKG